MSRQDRKPMDNPRRDARRRWWRRALRGLGILVAVAVLLSVALALSLRSSSVRQALLRWAGDAAVASAGVHATARDFKLGLRRGELTVEGVELRATASSRPFLTVDSTQAAWSWRSLWGERVLVRSVRIDGAQVDLGAPLPELPESDEPAAEKESPAVDIEEIVLADGAIDCDSLADFLGDESRADRFEMWLDAFRVGGVEILGSYRSGHARLDLAAPRVVVESDRRPSIELALDAVLEVAATGELTLEELRFAGSGLELSGEGRMVSGDQESSGLGPAELSFTVQAEPARLVPDLTTGGRFEGDGELTLQDERLAGKIRLDARDVPAEILRPMISLEKLEIEGTSLDADVDLTIGATMVSSDEPLDRLAGHAEVAWRRGDESLVAATLRALEDGPRGIGFAFEADVLPAEAGSRRASGELWAPSWLNLGQGELTATRVDLDSPDLAATAARLGLAPEVSGFRLIGEMRASTEVSGPVLKPNLNLDASWRLDDEPLAEITARTLHGVGTGGPLHLALEAELLPNSPGRRRLTSEVLADDLREVSAGELEGTRLEDLRLEIEIPDLAAVAEDLRRHLRQLRPGEELPGPLAEDSGLAVGVLTASIAGAGPVLGPNLEADVDWRPASGERVHLELAGDTTATQPFFSGEARLRASGLDAGRFVSEDGDGVTGRLAATLDFEGDLVTHDATLDAELTELRSGDGVGIERLALQARSDGSSAWIDAIDGSLSTGQPFSGQGTVGLALLPPTAVAEDTVAVTGAAGGDGELRLELPRPIETLERLVASVELDDGIAVVELALAESAAQPQAVALARVSVAELLAGEGKIELDVSGLEIEPFVPLLGLGEGVPRPRATIEGVLAVDLADLLASTGTIEISDLALEGPETDVEAAAPLRLELRDRRLILEPARLLGSGGGALEVGGHLELSSTWRSGDDPSLAIEKVELDAAGRFEISVLNPLLGGGRASGELAVALAVRGSLSAPDIEGRFEGPGVELFHAVPYVTRLVSPTVEIGRHLGKQRPGNDGGTALNLQARLNGGDLEVSGDLNSAGDLALSVAFTGVRYRLDYGLTTRLAGDLALRRPAGGPRSELTGDVVLERGSLRNDVLLDRDTLARLLAPDTTSVEDAGASDLVDLDLTVTTAAGVSIKNNLGQLQADWSRLRVRGTLQNPVLSGQIDVDPGGTLTAYGQTLRIDEASIAFSGDSAAPRIVLETTSSLEDPSVKRGRGLAGAGLGDDGPGSGGYWNRRQTGDVDVSDELTVGVLTDLGDRAAGSLGRGLARTELSLEPLQIFGETDTSARLTASQQISGEANLIYSVNPRDAEGQTYILELRDPDIAPSLTAQVFTNDDDNAGVTLQQTLQLGPGGRSGEQGRRLGGTRIHAPEAIDRRRLKQALGLRKSDPFPEDAEFDVEVDAIEALRRQGYPGAEVKVVMDSGEPQRPIIDVMVDPGPKVRFEFEGTRPPRPQRRSIVQAYNANAEEASLEALEEATVKALRGQGYLEPRVKVTVEAGQGDEREVRIVADGGERASLERLRFSNLPDQVAQQVGGHFESVLSRVELAIANPGADGYLLQSLAGLGYARARIVSRQRSEDGRTLTVELEPGRRQQLARVEILGLQSEDAARLAAELPIAAGDPLRSDLITRAAHQIEDTLRQRGHAEATVQTSLEPAISPEHSDVSGVADQVVRFEVDAGPVHQIAGMRLQGLHGTRPAWAERLTGLESGAVFFDEEVGQARRRLMATGLFEGVRTDLEHRPRDRAETVSGERSSDAVTDPQDPEVDTTVVFDFNERPRYQVSYGGRWESGEGLGLVVDAVDQSFLGRGTTLGLRAIYANREERSLRLYHAIPRITGPKSSLEVFLEGKNEKVSDLLVSGVETWTQLTFSLSRRARSRLYFRYQDLSVAEATSAEEPADPGQRLRIPSLGWQFSFDTRDRALGARSPDGVAISVDLVASDVRSETQAGALGIFSQLKLFHSFAEGQTGQGLTWAQSFRLGLQEPFENAEIPSVSRLRAGGEYSVRGYRRESLGPLDSDNGALGGELLFVVNQELRFPLWGEWLGGLVFFDAGNVWSSREALDSELFTSAGFGLRAATPAGPLRLDIAVPLDRRPEIDESVRIYLGFGNVF